MVSKGNLKVNTHSSSFEIDLSSLCEGINDVDDYFVRISNGQVVFVVDKICDHAGGRLVKRGDFAICPMHEWRLDMNSLIYDNGIKIKDKCEYVIENNKILLTKKVRTLQNMTTVRNVDSSVSFRWLNHASILIKNDCFSIVTDPWLKGSAFLNGWWLKTPSTIDSLEALRCSNAVLISHNHPDHLNMDTLSVLEKDHLILVPKYISGSTEGYLLSHGFTNVHAFDFNIQVELCENFSISFLKSGDFRDDSGFYVSVNGREFLLTVDANFLNSYVLPENIDVLMTSFASGASGFPLCYENYSKEEKRRIIRRNKAVILNSVNAYMDRSKPSFYMPYAGMFEEVAERDEYIKLMNQKNDLNVMNHFCEKKGIMYLDPNSSLEYSFTETGLSCRQLEVEYLEKDDAKAVIDAQKVNSTPLNFLEVKDYFSSCGFIDKQHLYIILTDDFFTEKGPVYFVDFNSLLVKEVQLESISDCSETNAVMIIRVREESLARVIREKLPWEDLSIGFQLRIFRNPNVYEAKFWYHFTNVYIRKEHFRYNSHCGSCNLINQNPQLI